MNRFLYTLLLYLLTPFILLKLLWRSRKAPAYGRRWCERFGFFRPLPADKPVIWVHAVSVGETIASAPLVKALMERYPDYRCLVTTMTPTGSDRVKAIYGETVEHVYIPYDLPGAQERFLNRVNPEVAIFIETELWPNTIAACHKRNIPVIIANARLSERSAKGYKKLGSLTRSLMKQLSVVACQNKEDGQRFIDLGLPPENLEITGSVKFDISVDKGIQEEAQQLKKQWQQGLDRNCRIFIAASTHDGEDQAILDAFKQLREQYQDLLLVLVPRHPERFDSVYELIKQNGFVVARHSQGTALSADTQVVLADTMGELLKLCGVADIAFVGGSLIERGGHNILEPAVWGIPVLSGPHVFNFKDICQSLEKAGGLIIVDDGEQLVTAIKKLLDNREYLEATGNNGELFIARNRGALKRLQAIIAGYLQ
ncbi:lipid IV(A) 3-deoxy-D-manno-octulosonic acid transferase [Endozoicomonas sp. Mp262]|uniref:lipid IV(A) 3-deoxy-D-manno-octulosonic acid transferase n=1 Tax=Endozoicomonas sp. Mp262 TaxID=2919499 RepID=UPI0021D99D79